MNPPARPEDLDQRSGGHGLWGQVFGVTSLNRHGDDSAFLGIGSTTAIFRFEYTWVRRCPMKIPTLVCLASTCYGTSGRIRRIRRARLVRRPREITAGPLIVPAVTTRGSTREACRQFFGAARRVAVRGAYSKHRMPGPALPNSRSEHASRCAFGSAPPRSADVSMPRVHEDPVLPRASVTWTRPGTLLEQQVRRLRTSSRGSRTGW